MDRSKRIKSDEVTTSQLVVLAISGGKECNGANMAKCGISDEVGNLAACVFGHL